MDIINSSTPAAHPMPARVAGLLDLPSDFLAGAIFARLSARERGRLAQVCKYLARVAREEKVTYICIRAHSHTHITICVHYVRSEHLCFEHL